MDRRTHKSLSDEIESLGIYVSSSARLDELQASGQLDAVLKSGRFADKLLVLDAHARGESVTTQTVTMGPALIVERVWRECGIAEVSPSSWRSPRRKPHEKEGQNRAHAYRSQKQIASDLCS